MLIRAVVIADRLVAFYDALTLFIEMTNVGIVVLFHKIHRTEDVLVIKIRLFKGKK